MKGQGAEATLVLAAKKLFEFWNQSFPEWHMTTRGIAERAIQCRSPEFVAILHVVSMSGGIISKSDQGNYRLVNC